MTDLILYHTILQQAASAEYGIAIRTSDPYRARTELYNARKELNDPTLTGLQIRVSPDNPNGEIWLLRSTNSVTVSLVSSEDLL
jgi:hypothetical protein